MLIVYTDVKREVGVKEKKEKKNYKFITPIKV